MTFYSCALRACTVFGIATLAHTPVSYAQSTPVPLDEIIVTGSPLSVSPNDNLTGTSVISGEELRHRLNGSLGETLKSEPGISSSFFGPGASRPIIRGQGGNRIRILSNGIGSIDASATSPDHASAVEPALASRIEIVRGSGLLRYGSSGSGGIINVIDGRIHDHIPTQTLSGAGRLSYTSVDNGLELALASDYVVFEKSDTGLVLHLEASHRNTDDYNIPAFAESEVLRAAEELSGEHEDEHESPEGMLENSATETTSFAAGLSYIGVENFIGFSLKAQNADYGIPGGHEHEEESEGEDEEGGVTIALEQIRFDVNSQFFLHSRLFDSLTATLGIADYTHTEFEPDGLVGTVFKNKGWETRAEVVQNTSGIWKAAHGIHLSQRDFSAIGAEAFVPPSRSHLYSVYSFHEWDISDVKIEGAIRYEHNTQTNLTLNSDKNFNGISLSSGLKYDISDTLQINGNIYRTLRAPSTEELYSNGPHLATHQYEVGDATLGNETAFGVEAAFSYVSQDQSLKVNLFNILYDDYIFERSTGQQKDGLDIYQFSAIDARFQGFEIELGSYIANIVGFDISGNASLEYVKAQSREDDKAMLPRIPPLGISLGLEAKHDKITGRVEVEHAAAKDVIAPNELVTKSYTLFNASLNYKVSDHFTARLAVNNITNADARQHTSFLKEIVPLPARNVKLTLSSTF